MEQTGLIEFGETRKINGMNSLQIAEVTGKRHDAVLRDIRNILSSGAGAHNFVEASYNDKQGKVRPMYELTPKGCLILASGYDVVLREKIIDKLEEYQQKEKSQQQIKLPQTYAEALRELADKAEQNERLMLENKQQLEKIQHDAPKVNYFEAFMNAAHGSKSVGIREVVKQAHIKSEKRFINWMLEKKILFRQKKDNRLQPYAEYAKCFDSIDVHDASNDWSGKQLLMNPFGKLKIVKRYHEEQPLEFDSPRDMFNNPTALVK